MQTWKKKQCLKMLAKCVRETTDLERLFLHFHLYSQYRAKVIQLVHSQLKLRQSTAAIDRMESVSGYLLIGWQLALNHWGIN